MKTKTLKSADFIKSVKWIFENIGEADKHREYLKLYSNKGKRYSFSVNQSKEEWLDNYVDSKFEPRINLIERLPNVLLIEFDTPLTEEGMKPEEALEECEKFLKKQGWAYIKTTHKGKCNYIWIEFSKPISDEEAKKFLVWVNPKRARIDLNFASSIKVFPVIFAPHRKYPNKEEIVYFNEGEKINYSKLKIPKDIKIEVVKEKLGDGFVYETTQDTKSDIKFDFEDKKPETEIKNLNQLKEIIIKNFPTIWFETRACLSACATLSLKNLNGCPSLNLVGNPSGEKTTALSFFYGQDKTYLSDDFTPRAFVTQSANVSEKELENVDLLPKLKNRILITPELAPLFEAPKDNLIENFAMLTRVLDGEGLNRDSGTHGHRGYSGDYKFVWLGGTTPLKFSVWQTMGKIGNRLFFLNMRDKNREDKDYLEMFRGRAYEEKVKECRGAVKSFLNNLFNSNGIRVLEWDNEGDILLLPEIIRYAKLLSKLRGSLMTWKSEENRGSYEYNFPIIEEPPRAINSLYNLAKGHALICGRSFLRKEDLEIVRAVCFSSMPHDRSEFLKLLAKHEGKLTTRVIEKELNCSQDTALRTMSIFEILGVVKINSIDIEDRGQGRPLKYIEIKPEFAELLQYTQGLNPATNIKPQESTGVSDEYFDINPKKLIKILDNQALTPLENNAIKPLSQEITPVSEPFSAKEVEE